DPGYRFSLRLIDAEEEADPDRAYQWLLRVASDLAKRFQSYFSQYGVEINPYLVDLRWLTNPTQPRVGLRGEAYYIDEHEDAAEAKWIWDERLRFMLSERDDPVYAWHRKYVEHCFRLDFVLSSDDAAHLKLLLTDWP
ncbi:hypothetical protein ACQUZK_09535, partial [Streptococcus pyogenes]|uniref:hypothetical protein n=1 Tax=Streptococcus pyogenes TaxID=1314 RepID=UPI003DA00DCD